MIKKTNNSKGRVAIGALLILFGILFFLRNFHFEFFDIDLFSWPVIFFIIGIIIILNNKSSFFGLILVIIGGSGIASNYFGISFESFFYEYWPFILIILGIYFIFKKSIIAENSDKSFIEENEYLADIFTIFGETKKIIKTNKFLGGKISSIMGESQIDLRNSNLADGKVELDTLTLMGSTEINIPIDWKVIIKTTTIFGAFEDLRGNANTTENTNVLVVKGLVLFGGGEIR
ncbi:MAG: hypothetical protein IPH62_02865 [Ignavibacteriae bacterium]|nr:hypothetical protein [Ignavibacteriota bacterium]